MTDDHPTEAPSSPLPSGAAVTGTEPDDPAAGSGLGARQRNGGRVRTRVPAIVWWMVALHVTVLGAYSILLPTFRAPDEAQHVDLAHFWSTDFDYPAWDDRLVADGVRNAEGQLRPRSRSAHLTAQAARPKDERASFEQLDEVPIPNIRNQLAQHPPLYYIVAGTAERATEVVIGDPDFVVETWFYRLVSIAMVAPLPYVIWRASRLLELPEPVAVGAMLLPLAFPQYLHIGASVNNDNLQYLATWLMAPIVLRVARGDLAWRTMALAGVLSGIGLLTKAFAFVIPAWMACALLLVLLRQGRAALPGVVRAGLVYAVPAMALGGWWWVRNVVLYGSLMPTRYFDLVEQLPRGDFDPVDYMGRWMSVTVRRVWGDFGYFDTHIPSTAVTIATTIAAVTLLVGVVGRDRVAGTKSGDRLLLLVPLPLLMAMQLQTALRTYLDSGQYAALQGRYWFGALAPAAILISLGAAKALGWLWRWLPLVVLAAIVVMQGLALSTILGFYWGAPGSAMADRLRAVVAWAPVPGELVGVAFAAGAIVGGAALVEIGRVVRRGGRRDVVQTDPGPAPLS